MIPVCCLITAAEYQIPTHTYSDRPRTLFASFSLSASSTCIYQSEASPDMLPHEHSAAIARSAGHLRLGHYTPAVDAKGTTFHLRALSSCLVPVGHG
ncbi:unnamed protein product, partial [Dicrocoelium dendriticum]